MLGLASTPSARTRQSGGIATGSSPAVRSVTSRPPRLTVRPSAAAMSAARSGATISITSRSSASRAGRLAASRTAASAHSALRPCSSASARI